VWFTEQRLIRKRVLEPQALRFSELIECVAWAFLERSIFSLWMPGLDEEVLGLIHKLEASIEQGGAVPPPPSRVSRDSPLNSFSQRVECQPRGEEGEDLDLARADGLAALPGPAI